MPRPPQIRVSYTSDANFLLRLKQAVELDTKRPANWRRDVATKLNSVAIDLLQAPQPKKS